MLEDFIWAVHAAIHFYYSVNLRQSIFFGMFSMYIFVVHCPRMALRIQKPYFKGWTGAKIHKVDTDSKAWMAPMLLGMPLLAATAFYDINTK